MIVDYIETIPYTEPLLFKGSEEASCYDVRAMSIWKLYDKYNNQLIKKEVKRLNNIFESESTFILNPGSRVLLGTGVKVNLPDNYHCLAFPRSSTPLKKGLILGNSVGVIDEDYLGEIGIIFINTSIRPVNLVRGERIAQLLFEEKSKVTLNKVTIFETESTRGEGGFGSTGI